MNSAAEAENEGLMARGRAGRHGTGDGDHEPGRPGHAASGRWRKGRKPQGEAGTLWLLHPEQVGEFPELWVVLVVADASRDKVNHLGIRDRDPGRLVDDGVVDCGPVGDCGS